ncbi:hypothetical protein ACQKMV_05775 [Lysinibacillus sp. NPDC094403]|uniref:hypothetical protein n=1 Tax=Lysinibacillus sp. NPDC094403 TaxID=3390581 RepID=UPI003D067081
MVVISTIVIIVLLIVFGCIGLANLSDKNKKQNNEQNLELNKDDDTSDDKGYFLGWWKVALVALLLLFLINACVKNIDVEPNIPNDWNYDGKVDEKDTETFIKWKINQEEKE